MLIRTLNVAAKSASHSRKGLEGVAFAVTKLMADTRDPESFETSEPSKEIECDCGCGYAAPYSCVRFGVNCRLILQKEHNDGNRRGNLPPADQFNK
jgi:hypothetical protein